MKRVGVMILVGILLLSGCQKKPEIKDEGMLPAPSENTINNLAVGSSLKDSTLQVVQTAPIRVGQEIVRLTIEEKQLDGCTTAVCEELTKAGLKGSVLFAGTKLNPEMTVFQLLTSETLMNDLNTVKGTFTADQVKEKAIWSDETKVLVEMTPFLNRETSTDVQTITEQMKYWIYNNNEAVGRMISDYNVPSADLFTDLKIDKGFENLKISVAYLQQTTFPSGVERSSFVSIDNLSLNGDGYVISVTFNKKGKESVTVPVIIVQEYDKKNLNANSAITIQDMVQKISDLPSTAILLDDANRKIIDVADFFYSVEVSERCATAVGTKENKKNYKWANELVTQMKNQLITFYKNQIGK